LATAFTEDLMSTVRSASLPALLTTALVLMPAWSPLSAQSVDTSVDRSVDSAAVARRRLQPLPALGSAPETGFQFGATMLGVWEHEGAQRARPASVLMYALRSAKSQTRFGVEGEYWTRGNARRLAGTVVAQEFPLPFYGIGDGAPATAKEIFTPRSVEITLNAQQRIARAWYVTGGARRLQQTMTFDTNSALQRSMVSGVAGGPITELSAGMLTDTRDNLFAPRHGRWVQATVSTSRLGAASNYQFNKVRVDARGYRTLTGTHILAAHAQVVGVSGDVPFDQLALVGNSDILRGYEKGRYRDRWVGSAQAEYRSPYTHRIGAVMFAGAGLAAPSLNALSHRVLLPTYGAGMRVLIDQRQRTSVRVDYGRGRDGAAGLYVGFNQAF
jgi:hypothetical protein